MRIYEISGELIFEVKDVEGESIDDVYLDLSSDPYYDGDKIPAVTQDCDYILASIRRRATRRKDG